VKNEGRFDAGERHADAWWRANIAVQTPPESSTVEVLIVPFLGDDTGNAGRLRFRGRAPRNPDGW
jgi:hypothetical protein